jgi:thiol-disulfide isomerase/thioredoxin
MKKYLAYFLMVIFFSTPSLAQRKLPEAKIIAVYFYADWCGNCKVLSPKLEEAKKTANLNDKDILFITLDLTNKTTIHQSIMHAKALGIGEYVQEQGSATGYLALLDPKTKKEIIRFTRESETTEIIKVIEEKLGSGQK